MTQNSTIHDSETSPAIPLNEALNLFIIHRIRGYAPSMVEQDDGSYVVQRGQHLSIA